jgi:hypothetical protein
MNRVTDLIPDIRAFRPFLPAKEYQTSLRFYEAIGFEAYPLGGTLAELSLGPHAFLPRAITSRSGPKTWSCMFSSTTSVRGGDTSSHLTSPDSSAFRLRWRREMSHGASPSATCSIHRGCCGTSPRRRSRRRPDERPVGRNPPPPLVNHAAMLVSANWLSSSAIVTKRLSRRARKFRASVG